MATNVSAVYIQVVDDVISKIRDEFINFGAGENALTDLQAVSPSSLGVWAEILPSIPNLSCVRLLSGSSSLFEKLVFRLTLILFVMGADVGDEDGAGWRYKRQHREAGPPEECRPDAGA